MIYLLSKVAINIPSNRAESPKWFLKKNILSLINRVLKQKDGIVQNFDFGKVG